MNSVWAPLRIRSIFHFWNNLNEKKIDVMLLYYEIHPSIMAIKHKMFVANSTFLFKSVSKDEVSAIIKNVDCEKASKSNDISSICCFDRKLKKRQRWERKFCCSSKRFIKILVLIKNNLLIWNPLLFIIFIADLFFVNGGLIVTLII